MTLRRYDYGLVVEAPVLSRGLSVVRLGVDVAVAREPGGLPDEGRPIIPKDQIRGMLWHVLRDLEGEAFVLNWFGSKSTDPLNTPRPGKVHFTDLRAETPEDAFGDATRIAIDDMTGAVAEGHLVTIEQPWPVGHLVTFRGSFYIEGGGSVLVRAIGEALTVLPAIGAFKSAGFGRVDAAISPTDVPSAAQASAVGLVVDRHCELELEIHEPFCVDTERLDNNLFRGRPVIPGGAVKAVLARWLGDVPTLWQKLDSHLEAIHVGHARPMTPEMAALSVAVPRSLVIDESGAVHDLFQESVAADCGALRFQVDWKDKEWSALPGHYRQLEFDRDARTRTSVDWEKSGAKPGELFSISSIVPRPGMRWVSTLRFPDALPATVIDALVDELHGAVLAGLGRTDAVLTVRVRQSALPGKVIERSAAGQVVVCLETPALLFDHAALAAVNWDAQAAYRAYWQERGLDLIEAIADQQLQGGHIAIRYPPGQLRDPAATLYEPYILTLPGAVFKLRIADTDEAALQALLDGGLPLPNPLRGQANWRTCPFLPTNGYGECRTVRQGEHRGGRP